MNKKYENINMKMYDYMKIQNENVQDRIALEYFGREYTFKEVINNIDLVFNGLRNLGIKKGDEVCVLGLSTPEFVFVLYAVNRIGASLTILNPIDTSGYDEIFSRIKPKLTVCLDKFYDLIKDRTERNRIMVISPMDSLPSIIVGIDKIKSLFKGNAIDNRSIRYKDFLLQGMKNTYNEEYNKYVPNEKAIVIGTGGSTGVPKQVGISNEMLNNVVKQHVIMNDNDVFDIEFKDNEIFLDIIPPHLAYGICDIHMALSLRLKLCLQPNPDPKLFINQMKKYNPHHVLAGPVHWKQLINYRGNLKLTNLKNAVSGGEHLENEDEIIVNERLSQFKAMTTVREGVGLTEICGVGTYNSNGDLFTVGRPLPEYQIGIFKIDDQDKTTDECICKLYYNNDDSGNLKIAYRGNKGVSYNGEVCYKLPIDILGYIGIDYQEENNNLIRIHSNGEKWIHTGDIGYIREDNNLILTDRIKRTFSRNGWKIYPSYLAKVVSDSGLVRECVVIKRESNNRTEKYVPVLYAVLNNDTLDNREKLFSWCNEKIVGNYQLYDIMYVDSLPRTGAGKIDFKLVEEYDSNNFKLNKGTYRVRKRKLVLSDERGAKNER